MEDSLRFVYVAVLIASVTCLVHASGRFSQDLHNEPTKVSAKHSDVSLRLYKKFVESNFEVREILSALNRLLKRHKAKPVPSGGQNSWDFHEPTLNVSSPCTQAVSLFVDGEKNGSRWALEMVDATGKPGPGMLTGRLMFVGDIGQCQSVKTPNLPNRAGGSFHGMYCHTEFDIQNMTSDFPADVPRHWGFCLPDWCSDKDAANLVSTVAQEMNLTNVTFWNTGCDRPQPLPAKAIAVISLVGVFVVLVILGTFLDIFLIQRPRWRVMTINKVTIEDERREDAPVIPDTSILADNDDTRVLVVDFKEDFVAEYRPSVAIRLLLTFSLWTNGQRVLGVERKDGSLQCLHGVRVFSTCWVISGSTFIIMDTVTANLNSNKEQMQERLTFQVVENFTYAVDTFFLMSGLLVSYWTIKEMEKIHGKRKWLKFWLLFYVHRYIRLTPVYMMVMGIWAATYRYWMTSHLMDRKFDETCERSWWWNLIYVQNLVRLKKECFPWGWYLALDMQFYAISPLVLVAYFKRRFSAYVVIGVLLLVTTVAPGVLTRLFHYGTATASVSGHSSGDRYHDIVVAPYSRMGPYLVGLLLGFVLHRSKRIVRLHWLVNLSCWLMALALALSLVYGLYGSIQKGHTVDLDLAAAFNALSRTLWSVCVAWVVFCCATGHGGVVNAVLAWPPWIVLGRLTLSAYLVHPVVLGLWATSQRAGLVQTDVNYAMTYLACLLASFLVALPTSLLFEVPFLAMEKVLLKRQRRI